MDEGSYIVPFGSTSGVDQALELVLELRLVNKWFLRREMIDPDGLNCVHLFRMQYGFVEVDMVDI